MHPAGLTMLGTCCLLILLLQRRVAALAFFLFSIFVSVNQRIVIAGLDFDFIRILVLVAMFRVVIRGELSSFRFRFQDGMLIAFVLVSSAATIVRLGAAGLENRLGFALTTLGIYFMMRVLLRSRADIIFLARPLVAALALAMLFFMVEKTTGRNPFAFLGGVPELTVVRGGRLRCQGAFAHPIIAGVFFAMLVPYFVGLALMDRRRIVLCGMGTGFCLLIIFASSSSTPVSALILGLIGWLFWKLRRNLSSIRWLALAFAVFIHLAMAHGIFHLLARIDFVGGSTGYHRYFLIDRAIANIDEWFLVGQNATGHWGIGLHDVTNQFVLEAVNGGILGLACFVGVIFAAFVSISKTLRSTVGTPTEYLAYAFGVMMFVHVCVFISLSYFGQMDMIWLFTLASVETIAEETASTTSRRASSARRVAPGPRDVRPLGHASPVVARDLGRTQ